MFEQWLEKRYGKRLDNPYAQFDMSGIDWHAAFHPPRKFPKGHIREYDPSGEFTYKDQNPRWAE